MDTTIWNLEFFNGHFVGNLMTYSNEEIIDMLIFLARSPISSFQDNSKSFCSYRCTFSRHHCSSLVQFYGYDWFTLSTTAHEKYARKWSLAHKDWPGMFVDIFPKPAQESEREREDGLNKHTRNVAKSVHTRPTIK